MDNKPEITYSVVYRYILTTGAYSSYFSTDHNHLPSIENAREVVRRKPNDVGAYRREYHIVRETREVIE